MFAFYTHMRTFLDANAAVQYNTTASFRWKTTNRMQLYERQLPMCLNRLASKMRYVQNKPKKENWINASGQRSTPANMPACVRLRAMAAATTPPGASTCPLVTSVQSH